MKEQVIYLYAIVNAEGEYVRADDGNIYTTALSKADLSFDREEAASKITESDEKVKRLKFVLSNGIRGKSVVYYAATNEQGNYLSNLGFMQRSHEYTSSVKKAMLQEEKSYWDGDLIAGEKVKRLKFVLVE